MHGQIFCSQSSSSIRTYLPWICTSLAIGYAAYLHYRSRCNRKRIQMNLDKKHARSCEVNIDDIDRNTTEKKISYCRCWKSKTFPLCDGEHKCHNRENDDSVGPLNLVWRDNDDQSNIGSTAATAAAAIATDAARTTSQSPTAIINDPDMDIKSIDSLEESDQPTLGGSGAGGGSSSATGSNGSDDFDDQLVKIDSSAAGSSLSSSNNNNTTTTPIRSSNVNVNNNNNLSDEQLSSLEMIDDDNNFTTFNNDKQQQPKQ
ncbi:hypothetical protein HUG17_7699 [Dermatophagoides farinae]|uniref:CDGSH iron-sulfur domain-containing protein 2 homologue n=1 Tax=Dermatophagoides farinae TaxID=6954 RepID=A0A9D4NXW0_DERFA|nr:hypothetical protein HUG17_7699 [Dermatophagoides farinae]